MDKKYIVKTSLMTLPPLIGGMPVCGHKEFTNLKDAKKYAEQFKKFLVNKKNNKGIIEYTDEEKDFFGGCHVALSYDGLEMVIAKRIE